MVPEEIHTFTMMMEVSIKCMKLAHSFIQVDIYLILIISNFTPRKNIHISIPNQFNTHKMVQEEILMSKQRMVD